MRDAAFPRSRRLKRRRLIRPLFDRARPDVGRVRVGTVGIRYRIADRTEVGAETPIQVGFTPGRRRINARRGALRRHLRETFRRHSASLAARFDAPGPDGARPTTTLTLFVLYRGPDPGSASGAGSASHLIERDLPRALRRLERDLDAAGVAAQPGAAQSVAQPAPAKAGGAVERPGPAPDHQPS